MIEFIIKRKKQIALMVACMILGSLLTLALVGRKGPEKEDRPAAPAEQGRADKQVGKGQATVTLSGEKLKIAGIEVMRVTRAAIPVPLTATAAIELNADRTSKVSSRVGGRIVRLEVSRGDRVKAGQPLCFIDTVELDQMWSEYKKNKGRYELAIRNLKREEALFEKNVAPEKDVLKARQELSETEADLTLARERFRLLGIDVQVVESRKDGDSGGRPLIPIVSLVGGVVIEKTVTQGEVVSPEKLLFTVADLATLWVIVDVYERDMGRIETGAAVHVSTNAFPNRTFTGRISYVGDVVDDATRTVKARVTIDNRNGLLKPGMFATVSIEPGKDNEGEKVVAMPEESILIEGTSRYAFIRINENTFRKQELTVGRVLGKKREILEGLKDGDLLVTKGAFAVKSEYKKDALRAE